MTSDYYKSFSTACGELVSGVLLSVGDTPKLYNDMIKPMNELDRQIYRLAKDPATYDTPETLESLKVAATNYHQLKAKLSEQMKEYFPTTHDKFPTII